MKYRRSCEIYGFRSSSYIPKIKKHIFLKLLIFDEKHVIVAIDFMK